MNVFRKKSVEQTLAETGESGHALKRDLTWWDLAIMGVAVAVGAGIFSIGAQAAAFHAGPAVVLSFLIAGVVCGAAVMCYAEFASMIPVAGSAYTFTYTTVGEIVAWVIGWDLILEMLMAGSVVSKYWGVYLNQFFELIGWNINTNIAIGSFNFDLAPVIIVAFFTALLVMGTKIGARVDGAMTVLKIAIVFFVVIVGFFYVKASNFTPFIPPSEPAASTDGSGVSAVMEQPLWQWATGMAPSIYGVTGIISGAALVFFAFLGFDVVATASEETINPKKNVPLGIGVGLGLIIVLYTLVAIVTTGMVSYKDLAKQSDPSLAVAFKMVGADWAAKIISLGIVIGMATVVMVLLMGSARVLLALCRDGLLPRSWGVTSKVNKTPVRLQIAVGIVVALLAGFTNVEALEEMINIGTLSAFVLVSVGVLVLRKKNPNAGGYRVPLGPVLPVVSAVLCVYLMMNLTNLTWVRFLAWMGLGVAIYIGYGMRHSRLAKGE